jgi:hypothetical protein
MPQVITLHDASHIALPGARRDGWGTERTSWV